MLHYGTFRNSAPIYDLKAALRHRRSVVIAEVQRQPFDQDTLPEIGVLPLVMNVDVRLARVPGVAAAPDHLPFFNPVALFYGNTAALQVSDL